ncbi:hypothetical protein A0H76_2053 [Hepatospora eriocheir]|uniref:Uncharacterized protein n=1 Tax=Hepatospora eriocheir TaxID=1081669 RepID=A0A1X0QGA0_9MICR|nr:hypothetical protein A0H76_2053 [Hepatospora eriocheir]
MYFICLSVTDLSTSRLSDPNSKKIVNFLAPLTSFFSLVSSSVLIDLLTKSSGFGISVVDSSIKNEESLSKIGSSLRCKISLEESFNFLLLNFLLFGDLLTDLPEYDLFLCLIFIKGKFLILIYSSKGVKNDQITKLAI